MTMQYVKPTKEEQEIMQEFRDKYEQLYKDIENLLLKSMPKSRGFSLALTNLEQSNMWLNKALTGNDE